jgi:hypothetical protein
MRISDIGSSMPIDLFNDGICAITYWASERHDNPVHKLAAFVYLLSRCDTARRKADRALMKRLREPLS